MNRFNTAARLSSLALILASSTTLIAQTSESGQFLGRVTSSNGKPLAATVTVRGEKLMGARVAVADADGQFRIALLPPGEYTLTVVAPNYLTQKTATPIRLGLGAQLRQDFQLKALAEAGTVVEVMATSITADKSDSKTSVNYSAETLAILPGLNRGFEGGIDLSPGVSSGAGGQSYTAAIRGGKTQTAIYTLNGTSVGEDVSGMSPLGQGNVFFVEDSVEDMQVVLSPTHARYGRTGGGVINMATISGGNSFAGSIRKYIARNDWQANSPGGVGQTSLVGDDYANRKTDIVVSGPIWKDKIWFVYSTILAPSVSSPIALAFSPTAPTWGMYFDPVADLGMTWKPGTATTDPYGVGQMTGFDFNSGKVDNSTYKATFWQFKITGAITADHTISYEKNNNDGQTKNAGFNGGGTLANIGSYQFPEGPKNWYQAVNYKGALSSRLFVEASASEKHWTHTNGPLVPYPHVREYIDAGMIWPYGTNANTSSLEDNANKSAALNFKFIADWNGTHEIDWGYQYYESRHNTAGIAGPNLERFYVYGATTDANLLSAAGVTTPDVFGRLVGFLAANWLPGQPSPNTPGNGIAPGYRKYIGVDGIHANRNVGLYINDAWTPNNHWNFNGGLRIEKVRDTNTDGSVLIDYWSSLSPRFSMKYDPKGDSAHVFSFSAARYTEDITAGTTSQWVTSPGNAYLNYGYTGLPVNNQATWISYSQLVNRANYSSTPQSQVNNSAGTVGLKGLRSPYVMEYTLGYRRNKANGSYFSLTYVQKEWYNDIAQQFNAYDLETWKDIQLDPGVAVQKTLANRVNNSPDIRRSYKGLEVEFKENLTSRLTLGGSYTYSRLTGNDNGGDSFAYPYKTNGVSTSAVTWATQYYSFRDALLASGWSPKTFSPYGPLLADAPQKARIYLSYNQPLGGKAGRISYSLMGRYDSGSNWDAISGYNAGNTTPDLSVYTTANQAPTGTTFPGYPTVPSAVKSALFSYYSSARGAFHQNDNYSIDAKIDFQAPLGFGGVMLIGSMKVSNLFNTVLLSNYNNTMAKIDATNKPTPTQDVALRVSSRSMFGTGLADASTGQQNPYAYNNGRYFSASMGIKF